MVEYEFIEYIKRKRLGLFMSQKDLAKKIPTSHSTYCKLECHKKKIDFFMICRLSELLDIDLNMIKSEKPTLTKNYD